VDKTVLITGAARGIGLATSEIFSNANYNVLMLDRDTEELKKVSARISNSTTLSFDISDTRSGDEISNLISSQIGELHVLINNAGIAQFGAIESCNSQIWREVMDTNLDGMFYLSQALIPLLKKTRGSVVNIASISGLRASTLRIAYGTSKAAVIQLSKQQAVELGEYGIRVNCVAPGPVRTKLAMAVHTPEIIDAYHDAIPLNRYGRENEIAEVIFFLASEKASYVTGQVIAVDGGFEATGVGLPALR
tara:strand:- start:246 stop:992 length:747 start_codon:yes stop_codon:yes gene_type:complete